MIAVVIKDGVVVHCVGVDSINDLVEFYPEPEHILLPQTGEENIGWTYDGMNFTAPRG